MASESEISGSLPQLPALIDPGVFDTFQIPYSCLAPQHHDLITRAAESGVGIIIRGGIAQGGPDAEIQRPALNDIWSRGRLDELLPGGMKRAELILRYTLSHPHSGFGTQTGVRVTLLRCPVLLWPNSLAGIRCLCVAGLVGGGVWR